MCLNCGKMVSVSSEGTRRRDTMEGWKTQVHLVLTTPPWLMLSPAVSLPSDEAGRRLCKTPPAWTLSPPTGRGQRLLGQWQSPLRCRQRGRPVAVPSPPADTGSVWSNCGMSSAGRLETGGTGRWGEDVRDEVRQGKDFTDQKKKLEIRREEEMML